MSQVQPQGDALKKAIQWISEQRQRKPDLSVVKLANDAALQFDLSPRDSEFLVRFVKQDPE